MDSIGLPSDLAPAKPTIVYNTFWRFAAERQSVYFHRLGGLLPPWTDDLIIRSYKFTNAYRASDRVSQYLIKQVIYSGDQSPDEVFFRIILFKLFNKIETWELLASKLGTIAYSKKLVLECERIITQALIERTRVYSAAYIMPSGGSIFSVPRKHSAHLRLLTMMMEDGLPGRVADCDRMGQAFELLRSYPMLGDFLSYQFVTDLNYSNLTHFSEMEFVMPGPGARDGMKKCFSDLGGLTESEMINVMANRQNHEFGRLGLSFQSLWGRPPQQKTYHYDIT